MNNLSVKRLFWVKLKFLFELRIGKEEQKGMHGDFLHVHDFDLISCDIPKTIFL